ncbi:MAG: hypothetical protein PHU06_04050 [Gallionella sp.]|nr:hypothetical protein [Gallionella sp.]MDD4958684.1 hypothetical protein [Gallionella sp.]
MSVTVDFKHDVRHNIVFATPHGKIETEADCQAWFDQYSNYFQRVGRQVDVIFLLGDLSIDGQIMTVWGEYRVKLFHENHVRFSYRVSPQALVSIATTVSILRTKTPNPEKSSIGEAIAAIKADRAKAGIK